MAPLKNNRRYKILYKKFLILRTTINNDSKIFKLKQIRYFKNKELFTKTFFKLEKKKWKTFRMILGKRKETKIKFKPFTNYDYITAKFASQGNSFKKKFKKDLIAKKTFNYSYGNLMRKYLKKHMTKLYRSEKSYNYKIVCLQFFESRLDSVLYRSKFCFSIKNAKHLISHKHITVNNKMEKNRSYILSAGDVVRIAPGSFSIVKSNLNKIIEEYNHTKKNLSFVSIRELEKLIELFTLLWPIPPKYLIINYKTLEIIFGNIKNFNFSIYFPFKLNIYSIITNYYRH